MNFKVFLSYKLTTLAFMLVEEALLMSDLPPEDRNKVYFFLNSFTGSRSIPESYIKTCTETQFTELTITINHISYLAKLDNHHNDPFDKFLICQSIAENCILITEDKILKSYNIYFL